MEAGAAFCDADFATMSPIALVAAFNSFNERTPKELVRRAAEILTRRLINEKITLIDAMKFKLLDKMVALTPHLVVRPLKEVATEMQQYRVLSSRARASKVYSLEEMFQQRDAGDVPELNLVIKGDVDGSGEDDVIIDFGGASRIDKTITMESGAVWVPTTDFNAFLKFLLNEVTETSNMTLENVLPALREKLKGLSNSLDSGYINNLDKTVESIREIREERRREGVDIKMDKETIEVVINYGGQNTSFYPFAAGTVASLKDLIYDRFGVPEQSQRLLYENDEEMLNEEPLQKYNLTRSDTIYLYWETTSAQFAVTYV